MKATAITFALALVPLVVATAQAGPTTIALDPECTPSAQMPLDGRASPYDSASVQLGAGQLKVCYGRPSARGRTMIGGDDVPFGTPWRVGANEPTTLHTDVPIRVGDVSLDPGSYSIYAIPGPDQWEVVVNGSVNRWGIPISGEVRENDIGSVTVPRERPQEYVEMMTIRFASADGSSTGMIIEWEEFRVSVPIEAR